MGLKKEGAYKKKKPSFCYVYPALMGSKPPISRFREKRGTTARKRQIY